MQFSFLLVEPGVPSNIGASARALKTMGFNSLHLVNPCNYLNNEAKWLAHGSDDILENAKVFKSFDEAVLNYDFLIGTTSNKKRAAKHDYHAIDQLHDIIKNKKKSINHVGVVFGKEESGLSNQEIEKCDIVSYIPLATEYPSLNLSQAVMLYAYQFSKIAMINRPDKSKHSGSEKYRILKEKVDEVLQKTKISDNKNLYNRYFERLAVTNDDDINLILTVCGELLKKLNH